MPIAEHPLHRSGRAELPHPAPTLGDDAQVTYPLERAGRTDPARCPGCVALGRVPLGPAPSLHRLRRRSFGVVRRLRRYYGPVRLPTSVRHRRMSFDFSMRSAHLAAADERGISRFPREVRPYMLGVSDRARSHDVSPSRRRRCCLPLISTASVPRSNPPCGGAWISRLDTRPARTPVNASPASLRTPAHDSGPVWLARPSLYESFIHNTSPV